MNSQFDLLVSVLPGRELHWFRLCVGNRTCSFESCSRLKDHWTRHFKLVAGQKRGNASLAELLHFIDVLVVLVVQLDDRRGVSVELHAKVFSQVVCIRSQGKQVIACFHWRKPRSWNDYCCCVTKALYRRAHCSLKLENTCRCAFKTDEAKKEERVRTT